MIIFFVGTGRLGNQLFQLNGIENVTRNIKSRTFLLFNMPDIKHAIESKIQFKSINNHIIVKLYDHYLIYFFKFLSRIRIIGKIQCEYIILKNQNIESHYNLKRGFLPFIWIPTLYFQLAYLTTNVYFSIKERHFIKAQSFFQSLPENVEPVFIHIRKTDYINLEVLGKLGADLPLSYYNKAISIMTEQIKNPFFIFLSDDLYFIQQKFQNIQNKVISTLDQYGDLALMSLCKYGILSNSSFSWWGAYFMKEREKVIVPKYWLGFKSGIEYPPGIIADWMEQIDF
jgi:hypothetical protein